MFTTVRRIRLTNMDQCGKCKGVPSQHNVRDATILVSTDGGLTVKEYAQHGFRYTGQ